MKIKNLEHPKTMPSLENRLIDRKVKDLINVIQEMEGLIENPERVGVKAEIGVTEMRAIVTSGQAIVERVSKGRIEMIDQTIGAKEKTKAVVTTDQTIEEKALKEMTETIDQTIEVTEMIEAIVASDQAIEEKAFKEMTETIDQLVEALATQIEEIKDLRSHSAMVLL